MGTERKYHADCGVIYKRFYITFFRKVLTDCSLSEIYQFFNIIFVKQLTKINIQLNSKSCYLYFKNFNIYILTIKVVAVFKWEKEFGNDCVFIYFL